MKRHLPAIGSAKAMLAEVKIDLQELVESLPLCELELLKQSIETRIQELATFALNDQEKQMISSSNRVGAIQSFVRRLKTGAVVARSVVEKYQQELDRSSNANEISSRGSGTFSA